VNTTTLLQITASGLYCPAGDFYIDPWRAVERAVLTHGHADHARPGCRNYLATRASEPVLRARLGPSARIQTVDHGETISLNGVRISLHPAGHILGSAQVRVECQGEVWVVSGDYKIEPDPTCTPFEPIRCHTFVTESTFGLPIYHWKPQAEVFARINGWWRGNRDAGRASVLFAWSLGKAQRLLAGVDPGIGPIHVHPAIARMNAAYEAAGVRLPATTVVEDVPRRTPWGGSLIVAPTTVAGAPWMRRFGDAATAFASGWMQTRAARRRPVVERGFVLSDHADWPGLLTAVRETGAQRVWAMHGYPGVLARWLAQQGLDAHALQTTPPEPPTAPTVDARPEEVQA
jgi:putative mRNA 3-end processing factor